MRKDSDIVFFLINEHKHKACKGRQKLLRNEISKGLKKII
jgi:hypothetical protein